MVEGKDRKRTSREERGASLRQQVGMLRLENASETTYFHWMNGNGGSCLSYNIHVGIKLALMLSDKSERSNADCWDWHSMKRSILTIVTSRTEWGEGHQVARTPSEAPSAGAAPDCPSFSLLLLSVISYTFFSFLSLISDTPTSRAFLFYSAQSRGEEGFFLLSFFYFSVGNIKVFRKNRGNGEFILRTLVHKVIYSRFGINGHSVSIKCGPI